PVAVDPVGDFGLDGLGEQLLGALAEEVGEDILGLGQWYDPNLGGRIIHGGVLLCRVGTFGDLRYTKSTPPYFILLSTTFDHTPRAGHGGANLALLRRVAVALLKRAPGKGTTPTKRLKAGWDDDYLLQVLQGIPAPVVR